MSNIVILGAGVAGFGAAHRLHAEGERPTIIEKSPYHGGHAASFNFEEGFVFDCGPHISFTKNERVRELFAESVDHEYFETKAYVNNYWKGYWLKHPVQCNLYNLPPVLVSKIICDFVDSNYCKSATINNYEDWLRTTFGDTFAETFPMEYTKKFHTTTANNLSIDWVGPRLYRPKLEEVLLGALSPTSPDIHYITMFRYPQQGGFVSFLKQFVPMADLLLDHKVETIDPREKNISLANGKRIGYSKLISSMPLPEIIPRISGTPKDVLEAVEKLACSEVVVVSIGLKRADVIDAHWTYFYDSDISITRLSTPHLQSPYNVPEGCGSLQAECYFSKKYRSLNCSPEECIDPVISDLKKVGILKEDDEIIFRQAMHLPYANVIFDHERAKNLSIVHGYLDDLKIAYCGRYGMWAYIWTDQSFESGEMAAEKILS